MTMPTVRAGTGDSVIVEKATVDSIREAFEIRDLLLGDTIGGTVRDTAEEALDVLTAYRQLAGERSQAARQALLRDLTLVTPDAVAPASLAQARREAALRQQLLTTPVLTYETLGELRHDKSLGATRTAVSRLVAAHRLFTVPVTGGRVVVPAFLVTADGSPRPELAPLLEPLMRSGMGPWQMWTWLTTPAALLSGDIPEQVAADPDSAPRAAHAARRLAARSGHAVGEQAAS